MIETPETVAYDPQKMEERRKFIEQYLESTKLMDESTALVADLVVANDEEFLAAMRVQAPRLVMKTAEMTMTAATGAHTTMVQGDILNAIAISLYGHPPEGLMWAQDKLTVDVQKLVDFYKEHQ